MYLLHMDLYGKIMSDPVNKWVFSHVPEEAFLTGGCIRDVILGRRSVDRDFSLKGNVRDIALRFSEKLGGKCIELETQQTFRIVLDKKSFIDFNYLDGTIEEDLGRRDFTLNAMAWSPGTGILDPFDGINSLRHKKIYMVNPENLLEDPVRILRGYRIAAQLGFDIDKHAREYMKKYAAEITDTSFERVTEEFFKLLNSDLSFKYMILCNEDNVLHYVLNVNRLTLINCFELLKKLKTIKHKIINKEYAIDNRQILEKLGQQVSQGLYLEGFIILSILTLHATVHYREHTVGCLKLSSRISKKLHDIHNGFSLISERITDKRLFEIYSRSSGSVLEMGIILSVIKKKGFERFIRKAEAYTNAKQNCLLNGDDIKNLLKTESGKLVGQIKDRLIREQYFGKIRTKSEAREFIISNLT